ncbi:MAG: hypothetical protein ACOY0T_12595 [Myxococcota bacterium]
MLRSLSVIAPLLVLAIAAPSAAETAAEDVAAARSLGVQGIQLADSGRCNEAIDKLERAEALYHAPTILGRLGECQVEVGQIVRGTENLNRVVREQLAPNAPAAFKAAQERAKKVLDAALPRIAYLTVKVEPKVAGANVTVDNAPVPPALIGAERPTDPGTHQVVASAAGYTEARSSVTLAEGAHQEVSLTLVQDPNAATATTSALTTTGTTTTTNGTTTTTTDTTPPPAAPTPAPAARDNSLAIFALGIGGAGLIVGGITGGLAISKKNSLECPDKKCPPSEHDALDGANTMAMISNVGFGVGIVGVALGTVLLITGGKKTEAPPATTTTTVGLRAKPYADAHSIGVVGSF